MTEADLIRQQMARIRHDLHKDVSGVRGGVERALDWKSLPRNYPLAAVVAALAAGYMIVPRRASAARDGAMAADFHAPDGEKTRPRRGFAPYAMGLLWPIAEQAFQSYAAMWIEDWIRQKLRGGPSPDNGADGRGSGNDFVFTRPVDLR
jgi:hypothetical protein